MRVQNISFRDRLCLCLGNMENNKAHSREPWSPSAPPSIYTVHGLNVVWRQPCGDRLDEYNQCVFVRYFRMPARKFWVPKMKAGAGPHDLGTGGRDGEGSSLRAQYDSGSGSDISSSPFDDDRDNDVGSATSIDSEPDNVTHNPTAVRYSASSPLCPFRLTLSRTKGMIST